MEHVYDVYEDRCPTRMVLDRIADKWALLILDKLRVDAVRFNLLRREIKGISQKVLSQTLKKLERDGLISRQAFPTVPAHGRIFPDAARAHADRHGCGTGPLGGGQYGRGAGGAEGL